MEDMVTELEKGLLMMAIIPTIACIVLSYFTYKKYQLKKKRKQQESDFIT